MHELTIETTTNTGFDWDYHNATCSCGASSGGRSRAGMEAWHVEHIAAVIAQEHASTVIGYQVEHEGKTLLLAPERVTPFYAK